jgi:hypothetical protein
MAERHVSLEVAERELEQKENIGEVISIWLPQVTKNTSAMIAGSENTLTKHLCVSKTFKPCTGQRIQKGRNAR